jgi:hypothetical protein
VSLGKREGAMSVRLAVTALAAGLLVAPAFADNAKPRGGGGGSSSSSAGSRHPSGGSGSASSRSSGSGGSSSGASQGSSSQHGGTLAERRHPRAGTGTGSFPGYGGGYYPYYPGWYYPYWPSYYGGYYGWGGYGYYGGPAYYSHGSNGDSASVRVLVDPEKTKVYVDGYYAGVADDFDGMFQRLYLAPGRHEIALKLDGFRTHKMLVYVSPGQTLKIERDLEKGNGPETFEDLTGGRGSREEDAERPAYRDDDDNDVNDEFDRVPAPAPRGGDQPYRRDGSRLRLDVSPSDASVYLDGQFQGPAGELGELILPPGSHRVEIVRPGFRTEERDVQLAPGSSRTIRVELARP